MTAICANAEAVTLASNLVGEALDRDVPDLEADRKFVALVYGVHLILRAGAYAFAGKLYLPGSVPSLNGAALNVTPHCANCFEPSTGTSHCGACGSYHG